MMSVHLGEVVRRAADRYGDRCAVIDGDRRASFRDVDERANRFGNAMLAKGLKPGDRVGLLVGNRLEWFAPTFGLLKPGLIRPSVNPPPPPPELLSHLTAAHVLAVVFRVETP